MVASKKKRKKKAPDSCDIMKINQHCLFHVSGHSFDNTGLQLWFLSSGTFDVHPQCQKVTLKLSAHVKRRQFHWRQQTQSSVCATNSRMALEPIADSRGLPAAPVALVPLTFLGGMLFRLPLVLKAYSRL